MLIGYFEKEDSETYKVFAKVTKLTINIAENFQVANVLQDDCEAIVGFGNVSYPERHTGENIVFKDVENGNAVSSPLCLPFQKFVAGFRRCFPQRDEKLQVSVRMGAW